ncbi:MAG TPA: DUF1919 domain-containing protein [Catalimonadaceae bacterium]|nr:DUF1919 domain-containing protein [Catalimonadaceae bacterium]
MIGRIWLKWKQHRAEQQKKQMFAKRRSQVASLDFAIIANNCWGGEIYKYYDLPFTSPFIGLYLYPDCYLNLLENWDQIDLQKINIGFTSRYKEGVLSYPVGILDNHIEVHFLHYHSLEEADSKWKRRSVRLKDFSKDQLYIKFCDREGAVSDHFNRFDKLLFPNKISFSVEANLCSVNCVSKPDPAKPEQVDDGVKLFWNEMNDGFDLPLWLNRKMFPARKA